MIYIDLNIWVRKKWKGLSSTKATSIYLTSEQKPFAKDVVELIDGSIDPNEDYINSGLQDALDILYNPENLTNLDVRSRMAYESTQLFHEYKAENVFLEVF